jgi:LPXTG-site transpeptidase (sortase) family protein
LPSKDRLKSSKNHQNKSFMKTIATLRKHKTPAKPPFAVFLAATVVLFFCTISAADSIGFVPNYIDGTTATASTNDQVNSTGALTATGGNVALSSLPQLGVENTTQSNNSNNSTTAMPTGIEPVKLIIAAGNINLPIQNPSTTNVDSLDALLKNGPAHYVNSADLGQSGNLIIFAHSSHLPIVTNKMFQAFNNVPNLNAGDSITVVGSDGKNYNYSVVSVIKADTNSGTTIDTSSDHGTNLTLVTCDTLTGVSARFILTATYIGVSNS